MVSPLFRPMLLLGLVLFVLGLFGCGLSLLLVLR